MKLLFVIAEQEMRSDFRPSQCYSFTLHRPAKTVEELRERHPGTPLVAAGVHASLEPSMTQADLRCDGALHEALHKAVRRLPGHLGHEMSAEEG